MRVANLSSEAEWPATWLVFVVLLSWTPANFGFTGCPVRSAMRVAISGLRILTSGMHFGDIAVGLDNRWLSGSLPV